MNTTDHAASAVGTMAGKQLLAHHRTMPLDGLLFGPTNFFFSGHRRTYTRTVPTGEENKPQTHSAFRAAALAQLDSLHRLAFQLCRDPGLAEDMVQETYLRAFRAAETFDANQGRMRPWLFKILHNRLRELRRREGLVTFDSDLVEDGAGVSTSQVIRSGSGLEQLNWEDVDDALKQAIDALPDAVRTVFLLFAVEGLKYKEIADVLDIPVGTVMSRLARARGLIIGTLTRESSRTI